MKMAKEKTSRLGTGLSALFGEEENVLEKETAQTLPISRVEPRKDQPRRTPRRSRNWRRPSANTG